MKKSAGLNETGENSEREWHLILKFCKGRSQQKGIIKVMLCSTLYNIWRERNHRRYRSKSITAEQLANEIIMKVCEHLSVVIKTAKPSVKTKQVCEFLNLNPIWTRKESIWCKWEGPEIDEITINTDGSFGENHHGYGGVLRDCIGKPILCFNGREGGGAVLEQELRAAEAGTGIAISQKFQKVLVASDSLQTINILKGSTREPWQLRNMVQRIRNNCNSFEKCRLKHIFRESNSAANWLAKRSSLGSVGQVILMGPYEQEFLNIVRKDANGALYQRL